jgi:hypothetical protein
VYLLIDTYCVLIRTGREDNLRSQSECDLEEMRRIYESIGMRSLFYLSGRYR